MIKINYDKVKEMSTNEIDGNGNMLQCVYLWYNPLERYLDGDTLSLPAKRLLLDLDIITEETEENSISNFNFVSDEKN